MSVLNNFRSLAIAKEGFPGHVISFDPGETTGWAWMHDYTLVDCGQIPTGDTLLAYSEIRNTVARIVAEAEIRLNPAVRPNLEDQLHIAIEDYRVYSWKSDDHKWAQIHTIKVVAICELIASLLHIPHRLRMAQHAKNFFTDDLLKRWNMYETGKRHARDAVRHACLYITDYKHPTQ